MRESIQFNSDKVAQLFYYDPVTDSYIPVSSNNPLPVSVDTTAVVVIPGSITVQQPAGSNLHTVVDSGNIGITGQVHVLPDTSNVNIVNFSTPLQVEFYPNSVNPNLDAYGGLRVSEPFPLFDCQTGYDQQPFLMDNIIIGGGSTTFLPNESSVLLNVDSSSGTKVTRRSRQWIRYQPGRSQKVTMTGVMNTAKTNVSCRIGYFDHFNGLFFEQTGSGIAVVRRTYTSGSVVNNSVPQAQWNMDTLDGSGNAGNPSGKLLDTTKSIIHCIDFQWLGVSRVRWGINFGDMFVYVHQFTASNVLNTVYMGTGNLPVTYELENTGSTSGPTTMKAICCGVDSEGGTDHGGLVFSNANISDKSVSTRLPLFSIQPQLTFNGIINRGLVVPLLCNTLTTSGTKVDIYVEIVYNGTLSGALFSSQSANSMVNHDTSATSIIGGDVIHSFFVSSASTDTLDLQLKYPLTLNAAGTVPDTLTIVATAQTGTATVRAGFTWKELR